MGILLALAGVAAADDSAGTVSWDVDAEGALAVGTNGLASGKVGYGARATPRLVYTSPCGCLQLRAGVALTWWRGVAPYGHATFSIGTETWLVPSASLEATWLAAPDLRLGPEVSAAPHTIFSDDSRYPGGPALAVGVRIRYRMLAANISVEHAWPSLAPPFDRATDSFVVTAGPSGRAGLIAAAASIGIGALLFLGNEVLPHGD